MAVDESAHTEKNRYFRLDASRVDDIIEVYFVTKTISN